MSKKRYLDKQHVIKALKTIRCEWDEAVNGDSLVEVKGSVGLLLLDVVEGIGLSEDEQLAVLGQTVIV